MAYSLHASSNTVHLSSDRPAQQAPMFAIKARKPLSESALLRSSAMRVPVSWGKRDVFCRFQQERRGIERNTRSADFHDDSSLRVGPVVVAVDHTPEGARAVKWALSHLCAPGEATDKLELVHVVCDPRSMDSATAVGRTPGGRERVVDSIESRNDSNFREYSSQLLNRAKDLVSTSCGKLLGNCSIPYEVHFPRLPGPRSAAMIGEVLVQEAERLGARALVVASHGPGAMAEFGSVARYCYQHASLPLVLIPSDDAAYFGSRSFDFPSTGDRLPKYTTREDQDRLDEVIAKALPATQANVPSPTSVPPAGSRDVLPAGTASQTSAAGPGCEVLLVVTHLPELEQHWQWVCDNLCRHGDVLNIWHVTTSDMPAPQSMDANLASLPTVLAQTLKARGLANVKYNSMYFTGGVSDVAKKVCEAAEAPEGPRMVCVLNYSRQGLLREALFGSVASELARHCPTPLVLLQPSLEEC